ncbi:hypothetical protein HYV82_02910 [Candidatus Woesearchaeota archaeon]|nr:hypothetical protein [Candidatus Woesearchaeota archaeon]
MAGGRPSIASTNITVTPPAVQAGQPTTPIIFRTLEEVLDPAANVQAVARALSAHLTDPPAGALPNQEKLRSIAAYYAAAIAQFTGLHQPNISAQDVRDRLNRTWFAQCLSQLTTDVVERQVQQQPVSQPVLVSGLNATINGQQYQLMVNATNLVFLDAQRQRYVVNRMFSSGQNNGLDRVAFAQGTIEEAARQHFLQTYRIIADYVSGGGVRMPAINMPHIPRRLAVAGVVAGASGLATIALCNLLPAAVPGPAAPTTTPTVVVAAVPSEIQATIDAQATQLANLATQIAGLQQSPTPVPLTPSPSPSPPPSPAATYSPSPAPASPTAAPPPATPVPPAATRVPSTSTPRPAATSVPTQSPVGNYFVLDTFRNTGGGYVPSSMLPRTRAQTDRNFSQRAWQTLCGFASEINSGMEAVLRQDYSPSHSQAVSTQAVASLDVVCRTAGNFVGFNLYTLRVSSTGAASTGAADVVRHQVSVVYSANGRTTATDYALPSGLSTRIADSYGFPPDTRVPFPVPRR